MNKFDLIYFCDGYPEIGMGHVFRGIDIMNTYIKSYPKAKLAIQGEYHPKSIDFIRKQLDDNIEILIHNDKKKCFVSIVDTMFYPGKTTVNHDFFKEVKSKSNSIIFLWDAIEYVIPHQVDIVINHLPYCKIKDDNRCEKYIGLEYSPVPLDYYENSNYKLNDGYLLCFIGGSEKPEKAEPLLRYIDDLQTGLIKIVILSPSYDTFHFNSISNKYRRIKFKMNVKSVVEYLNNATVAITTYGSTTFKSIASKVPTFTVAFREFKNLYATELENIGYCVNLGMFNNLNQNKINLLNDDNFKIEMHKKLKLKFSKPGIINVINIIFNNLKKYKN